jgi:hypothetical protein
MSGFLFCKVKTQYNSSCAAFISSQNLFKKLSLRSFTIGGILPLESDAGWSSLVARRAHNPKVVGSNPAPATNRLKFR